MARFPLPTPQWLAEGMAVRRFLANIVWSSATEGQWVCTPFIEEKDGEGRVLRIRKMLTYNNGCVVKENIEDVSFADLTQLCPQEETLDRVNKSLSVFSTHLVKVSVCRCC